MTMSHDLSMYFLLFGAVILSMAALSWRSGGQGMFPLGMLYLTLAAFSLAPAGWSRYVAIAAFSR
jgi:hypothetical protein